MAVRHVAVSGKRRKYTHSALMAPRMPADQCMIDGRWVHNSALDPTVPKRVERVNHFNRYQTAVGDTLVLETWQGEELARVDVTEILATHKDNLTDADLHALGKQSLDDLYSGQAALAGGPIWLIRFVHLIEEARDDRL